MSTTIAGPAPGRARSGRRIAWGALGLFLTAFGVFEATKHGGLAWYLFCAGALIPALSLLPLRWARFLDRWVLRFPPAPLAVIVYFTIIPTSSELAVPGFTFGLMWLAHIAVSRWHRPHRTVGG